MQSLNSTPDTLRILPSISGISERDWDHCARSGGPFTSHAFLSALEDSGSVTASTGWQPQHLVLDGIAGEPPLAVAPLYLKSHSYGEYVFDWGWADAYERAGGNYYPKLQCAVPFSPVTGERFLIPPGTSPEQKLKFETLLATGMVQLADQLRASSIHITFQTAEECKTLTDMGYMPRYGHQFHWQNDDYQTFDDFLATLTSRKRKQIKKERREVQKRGLTISALTGANITEAHWDTFFGYYKNTTSRKWGESYLTRPFFSLLGQNMGENIVLIWAEDQGRPVAAALNLVDERTLYGRNWGCSENYKFLHFEACYYAAIDYAIEKGLKTVEAGAQGEHKIQRGYLPTLTYSSHWVSNPGFRDAVKNFLDHERGATIEQLNWLKSQSPFKAKTENKP